MKTFHLIALAATGAGVSACNRQAPVTENSAVNQVSGGPTAQIYSGTGTVKSITGGQVAIAHGPIAGIGWPAMTMTFTVPPDMVGSAKVGALVNFSFRKNGNAYLLTSVKPR